MFGMLELITSTPVLSIAAVLFVITGAFFIFKGVRIRRAYSSLLPVVAHTYTNSAGGGIWWEWNTEKIYASLPNFYTFVKDSKVKIAVDKFGHDFRLNTWTHNGFFDLLLGSIGVLFGILATTYLLIMA